MREYLPFSCLLLLWIDFSSLQVCKDQLNRCCTEAIWTWKDDRELHLAKVCLHFSWGMVSCSIEKKYSTGRPLWSFPVQLAHEVLHEEHHYVWIGVSLCEGVVEVPICVQGSNQRKPGINCVWSECPTATDLLPHHMCIICLIDPRLIHIDYSDITL